ncbi:MAG TPA: PKD domain-containing protein [Anaerohalosphaeraceae bacterium]|nr:PKD domain-containing protein [Anaerohalosphaeraceae bacterium]
MKRAFGVLVLCAACSVYGSVNFSPEVYIAASPESPSVGQTITFDGSRSHDPNGMIVSYRWTLPGRAFCVSGINTSIARCKFDTPGTYTVWLTVEDDQGEIVTGDYTITISAATNSIWYVRPDGSDDNDGRGATAAGAFKTIQTAIDSASDGDEIRVFGGVYYEQPGLKGKAISIYSYNPENTGSSELAENAIIDANKQGTAVMFDGSEPNSCQIKGFTVRGGFPTGDSLALHLEFDDPNTIALDSSGKERNGIVSGDPNRVVGYDGIVDGAMEFNGNHWIQIEDYKGVAGKHPRSCAMWVKTTTAGAEMVLMSWGKEAAGQKWQLLIADSNEIALDVDNGRVSGTTTIHDGNWHHVAAVFEGNGTINVRDVKLYIDGVQEATTCSNYVTTPPDVNTELDGDVCLGASGGAIPGYYRGVMDEVRIYSRPLVEGEIQKMAKTSRPVAHWTLDAILGNTIADSTSNNRMGTFNVTTPTSVCSAGRVDNAVQLQNSEYIQIGSWTGVTGGNSRSCSAWIKIPTAGQDQTIASWGDDTEGQKWMFRTGVTHRLEVGVWDGYICGTTNLADGCWHHVAAVLNADSTPTVSEIQLYVDGNLESTTCVNPTRQINTASAQNVILGARHQAGNHYAYFTGSMDDVQIYACPLTAGEILGMAGDVGQMAYWPLDETMGAASADDSGNSIGGTWIGTPSPCPEGYLAGAVEFDGADDYISTSYNGVLGTRNRTVSAWIKAVPDNSLILRTIVAWGGTATGGSWNLALNYIPGEGPSGTIRIAANASKVIGTTPVDDNRWHHVAAVFANDGTPTVSDIQLYIDGKREILSYIIDATLNTGTGYNVNIGAMKYQNNSPQFYFKGKIDEVRIYDRALSETELRQMYEETVGGGITGHGTRASIQQCIITDNISAGNGGGIDFLNGFISVNFRIFINVLSGWS